MLAKRVVNCCISERLTSSPPVWHTKAFFWRRPGGLLTTTYKTSQTRIQKHTTPLWLTNEYMFAWCGTSLASKAMRVACGFCFYSIVWFCVMCLLINFHVNLISTQTLRDLTCNAWQRVPSWHFWWSKACCIRLSSKCVGWFLLLVWVFQLPFRNFWVELLTT